MNDIQQHPEFSRARTAIEEAVAQCDLEGGDLGSLAKCLLHQSAALYRLTHGSEGPDGLATALAHLAVIDARRAVQDHDKRKYGPAGRA